LYTWEQAYLDPPFENVAKPPYEISIPVLEDASAAPDIGERLTITAVSASHGGAVGIWDPNEQEGRDPAAWPDNSPSINYSPAAGFSGVETITYTVSDSNGATFEFTVEAHLENRGDVMQFRLEARNSAGEVIDRVRRGEMIDVYVYVTSGLDETAISLASAEIRYHPSQVERVGDVQFGDALPELQWWGDTKSSAISDLRTLGMKASAGFNLFDDPRQELILAQFSLQVVENGMVELTFDAKDCTGNLYDLWPATTVPSAAIEFVDLSLMVVTGWHNVEMPADVDGDHSVVPLDALIVINELNRGGSRLLSEPAEAEGEAVSRPVYYDVNNDSYLTPVDALQVINILNVPATEAEGEAAGNLVPGVIVSVNPSTGSQDSAGVTSLASRAATTGGAIVARRQEMLPVWAMPTVEDDLLDVLAIARKSPFIDGDAQMEDDVSLLSADDLLGDALGDHLHLS
ncbi:MAG: dockerin type I domain-containing protein, partial [Pirellulaceae bacterium]|nr:dockerin type I domain-containing protein [Pirellulaceae bacterium]